MKRTKDEGVLATLTTHRRHLVGAITLAMVEKNLCNFGKGGGSFKPSSA